MKFVASSTELLGKLQAVARVISSKNTLPILDNFLFDLQGNTLTITASDLESTISTKIELDNVDGSGKMAVPAKILTDTLKEFPEQPLTFDVNNETYMVEIFSENGKFSVMGQDADDFPQVPEIKETATTAEFGAEVLLTGINRTLFATADDELRPVMNGIFVQMEENTITFVASDAHKLVRYRRTDIENATAAAFILPKKPAGLLKNLLAKDYGSIIVQFDEKNAIFRMSGFILICRLVEGTYPAYQSVIPQNNPNKMVIDRADFYNTLRRVSVFSNQASNLVKLQIEDTILTISAQDIDFSISAYERLNCQFDGENIEIGFKSSFLIEILSNLSATDVMLEMSEPSRAGLLFPVDKEKEHEDILMLLMPMMINS